MTALPSVTPRESESGLPTALALEPVSGLAVSAEPAKAPVVAVSDVESVKVKKRVQPSTVETSLGPAVVQPLNLLDRDQSILSFNERVLDWARRPDVPLLERLRYLCIVSSNLDEFFEVRAVLHMPPVQPTTWMNDKLAPTGKGARKEGSSQQQGQVHGQAAGHALFARAQALVTEQYRIYNDELLPALEKKGIRLLTHGQRTASQKRWVREHFVREVQPLLVPVGLDPAHPFPQVANKSLNFIVRLSGRDAFGRENEVAIVKVPRFLPRYFRVPSAKGSRQQLLVSISSLIRSHLVDLFPGRHVTEFSQFRVTRHSDLAVDEEEVKNLRTALRQGLQQRHYGQAVRLEVSAGCSAFLQGFLLKQFGLSESALYRVHGPVNLVRLNQLIDLVDAPAMRFEAHRPGWPQQLNPGQSFFERLKQGDVLIHQPYETFDAVLAFLREAVEDPDVLAIKQTIYRTGARSELMDLLREAVRRGKEVTAVVELKARFDEEANINYAERLESVGAQVVYGVVGLKTHAKMMLITRRETKLDGRKDGNRAGHQLVRYAHVSTGNYNPGTARLYTDLSMLTADPVLTQDIEQVFLHLASQNKLGKLHKVLMAPFQLHKGCLEWIDAAARAAQAGLPARMVLKMNALTDVALAEALAHASQRGVEVELIIRGACILPAGVPGVTDRVRVRSVIGRLLEHSRVFWFQAGAREELWLSSADWMNRNMMRRVELAWPVTDPALRRRVQQECLDLYLTDTRNAWDLQPNGSYRKAGESDVGGKSGKRSLSALKSMPGAVKRSSQSSVATAGVCAQAELMKRYGLNPS